MSYSDMEKVLDNCLDMCGKLSRTPYFYITGGDPILHPDFWRLLELLKSMKSPSPFWETPSILMMKSAAGSTIMAAVSTSFPWMD